MTNLPWPKLEVPTYKEVSYGEWELKLRDTMNPKSYFGGEVGAFDPKTYTLSKWNHGENRTTWMSVSQFELESHMMHVASAHGHVVVAGLGMGMFVYNILQKPEVTRVSIFEIETDVINLMRKAGMWDWKGAWKIDMYNHDVLDLPEYAALDKSGGPIKPVDFMFVDIWPTIGLNRVIEDVNNIHKKVRGKTVGWWGQEYHFISWCNGMNPFDILGYTSPFETWCKSIGLPVTGYQWDLEYLTLCYEACKVVPLSVTPVKGKRKDGN